MLILLDKIWVGRLAHNPIKLTIFCNFSLLSWCVYKTCKYFSYKKQSSLKQELPLCNEIFPWTPQLNKWHKFLRRCRHFHKWTISWGLPPKPDNVRWPFDDDIRRNRMCFRRPTKNCRRMTRKNWNPEEKTQFFEKVSQKDKYHTLSFKA